MHSTIQKQHFVQIQHYAVAFLLCIALLLAGCAQNPANNVEPNGDRVDVVTLPKFGIDPHWGGKEIPAEILAQRAKLLQRLAERNADVNDFALEVTQTGWQAMAQSDFATAIRRFNQAWLVQPQTAYAIMGMAMVVFERDGDIKGGRMLIISLEEVLAEDGTYWTNRALMAKRAGMYTEALSEFQQATRYAPNSPIVIKNLVDLYYQAQNFPAACAMLTKARRGAIEIDNQIAKNIQNQASSPCSPS